MYVWLVAATLFFNLGEAMAGITIDRNTRAVFYRAMPAHQINRYYWDGRAWFQVLAITSHGFFVKRMATQEKTITGGPLDGKYFADTPFDVLALYGNPLPFGSL